MKAIFRTGYYSSLIAFAAIMGYSIAQILQLAGVLHPHLDEVLIYGFSLCIATPFLVAMIALHYTVPVQKRMWTHIAIAFSTMYAVFVTIMYVVQLVTVVPGKHPSASSDVLTVTPHSLFWTLDALGYIFMGLATLAAMPVFTHQKNEKWVRGFFLAHGLLTPLITFVYFYPHYSTFLLYFGSPWIITASGATLTLALYFRNHETQTG